MVQHPGNSRGDWEPLIQTLIEETTINSLQMLEVLDRFEYRCALTGSAFFHVDHWFPQKYGGLSNVANCYPLDATLNLRKNASNPFDFFEREDIRELFPKEKFDDLVFWLAVNNDMTVEEFRDYTNLVYAYSEMTYSKKN